MAGRPKRRERERAKREAHEATAAAREADEAPKLSELTHEQLIARTQRMLLEEAHERLRLCREGKLALDASELYNLERTLDFESRRGQPKGAKGASRGYRFELEVVASPGAPAGGKRAS